MFQLVVNNLGTLLHLQGKDAARTYATSLQAFVLLNVPTGGTVKPANPLEICNDGPGISEPGLRKARKVNNLGTVLHLQGKDAARKYATSLQAFFF